MTFAKLYLDETADIAAAIDAEAIETIVQAFAKVRKRAGRVFVLGLGGSAANAEHCVNDLRVRAGLEAYSPPMSEWTARGNDQGWAVALKEWLRGSRLCSADAVVLLSGSGQSLALLLAARFARLLSCTVIGILGTAKSAIEAECAHVVVIPCPVERRAGHAESFQAVVWHAIAAHPKLAMR